MLLYSTAKFLLALSGKGSIARKMVGLLGHLLLEVVVVWTLYFQIISSLLNWEVKARGDDTTENGRRSWLKVRFTLRALRQQQEMSLIDWMTVSKC